MMRLKVAIKQNQSLNLDFAVIMGGDRSLPPPFHVHKFKDWKIYPLYLNFNIIFALNVTQSLNPLEEKYSILYWLPLCQQFST